jgi:spore coat polysaccharide biosynthesis protein SpsF
MKNNRRVIATIQARMGSKRLPGKVLMNIFGKPMLLFLVDRIKRSQTITDVVVATTHLSEDDVIEELCSKNSISIHRGSSEDVLARVTDALQHFKCDIHVECFGDSPFVEVELVDKMVRKLIADIETLDIVTNAHRSTYPSGLETSVYKADCLVRANAELPLNHPLREHAGFNLFTIKGRFNALHIEAPDHQSFPHLSLEVDELADIEVVNSVCEHFAKLGQENFNLDQIIQYSKEAPHIFQRNSGVRRRWKVARELYIP